MSSSFLVSKMIVGLKFFVRFMILGSTAVDIMFFSFFSYTLLTLSPDCFGFVRKFCFFVAFCFHAVLREFLTSIYFHPNHLRLWPFQKMPMNHFHRGHFLVLCLFKFFSNFYLSFYGELSTKSYYPNHNHHDEYMSLNHYVLCGSHLETLHL